MVHLDKFIPGGQAIGSLENGKKVFVWGCLPGEDVEIKIISDKHNYAEAVVTKVLQASPHRRAALDSDSYLQTSPWQILDFAYENECKHFLVEELFKQFKLSDIEIKPTKADAQEYFYRNKYIFSFYKNNELAVIKRGTNALIPTKSISLPKPEILDATQNIMSQFSNDFNKGHLQKLLIRASADGTFGATAQLEKESINFGNYELSDEIEGITFTYAINSFWQANLPVYKLAINDIKQWTKDSQNIIDFYAGVGSIGLTASNSNTTLVENDKHSYKYLQKNAQKTGATTVLTTADKALKYIKSNSTVIFDPPRSGLNKRIVKHLLEIKPDQIIYLSCNPVTQIRDIKPLLEIYNIDLCQPYNFFPKTPHIENLLILRK